MSDHVKLKFISGFLLLFIPFALFLTNVGYAYFSPKDLSAFNQVVPTKVVYAMPTQIIIPKVKIDLPIEPAEINDAGEWEIGENGASYLISSAKPGEQKSIIMYGHNTNDRLGPIRLLTKGDHIEIMTADGEKHVYAVSEIMKVKPDKIDIFTQDRGEMLILYTCDGFADSERFVLFAKPLR